MALMSLVMIVAMGEVVLVTLEKAEAVVGVAMTMGTGRKLCSGGSSNCGDGDVYKGWKSQKSTFIFWTQEGRNLEAEVWPCGMEAPNTWPNREAKVAVWAQSSIATAGAGNKASQDRRARDVTGKPQVTTDCELRTEPVTVCVIGCLVSVLGKCAALQQTVVCLFVCLVFDWFGLLLF